MTEVTVVRSRMKQVTYTKLFIKQNWFQIGNMLSVHMVCFS